MSHNSIESNGKKNHLAIKIAAGFIVCVIAVAIASVAVSSMIETLDEVNTSSEAELDSLSKNIVPKKIPSLEEGIGETKKSVSHLSGIFSNFIKNP